MLWKARTPASPSTGLVLGITLSLLCLPIVADLVISGPPRPFGYAAADTFYYLDVARNVARHGSFSFDGEHATNGFHPLWQLVTAALCFVLEHAGVGRGLLLA